MWIRIDRIRWPLEAPYAGPFSVKRMTEKTVTITKEDGHEETISLSRVKPAIGISPQPRHVKDTNKHSQKGTEVKVEAPAPQPRTTRVGRKVHFPAHLSDFSS